MRSLLPLTAALAGLASALPTIPFFTDKAIIPDFGSSVSSISRTKLAARQSRPCFVIGSEELPQETSDVASLLANTVTCSRGIRTIAGVPDVRSGSLSFSSIDFSSSSNSSPKQQTPLEFALNRFATEDPLASSNLSFFQDALNAYLATEAGIRSVGGSLEIKVPKFFLAMQVSRIRTAQGNPPTEPGQQVEHLRDKVLKNAAREDQALLDQVTQLASQLQ